MKKRSFTLGLVVAFTAVCGGYVQANDQVRLTLQDCFLSALENNLDVAIRRNDPLIAQWEIVNRKSIFEPLYTFSMKHGDIKQPLSSLTRLSTGLSTIENETLYFENAVSGLLPLGTRYQFGASDQKSNGSATFFRSEYEAKAGVEVTQPLLKNFGFDVNVAQINVARINKNISLEELRNTLIDTLFDVQNRYWDLVLAYKDLEVLRENLRLAQSLLHDNTKKVEVGVLAPIEITQAKAAVAAREESVIVGEQIVSDRANDLKILIYPDPEAILLNHVVPIDEPQRISQELSFQDSLTRAFANRSEYRIAKKRLDSQIISVAFLRNQRLPEVNFVGEYNFLGVDNNFGNTIDHTFNEDTREWFLGVEVSIPLGNREPRSEYHIARYTARKLELEFRKVELNLVREVDNAIAQIKTNLKRVDATVASTKLAQEALDAEVKRFETGASTSHDVLQFQSQLSQAKVKEIQAVIDLNKSLFELMRVEGTLLDSVSVNVDDYTGNIDTSWHNDY